MYNQDENINNVSDYNENYVTGWIKVYRSIKKHWLWDDPIKFKWWIDILLEVNHTEKKVLIKEKLLTVKKGDSVKSFGTWAKQWKVNKSKVRRFLKLLESDGMIVIKNEQITTRLTVCNYDSYQDTRIASETQVKRKRNVSETQVKTNKNEKNEKNDNIETRKLEFLELLKPHTNKYSKDLLNDFYGYWTEHGINDKLMRYEKQTSFSVARRLGTWKKNEKPNIKNKYQDRL